MSGLGSSTSVNISMLSADQKKALIVKERHRRKIVRLEQVRLQSKLQSTETLGKVRQQQHSQKLILRQKLLANHQNRHETELKQLELELEKEIQKKKNFDGEFRTERTVEEAGRLKDLEEKANVRHKLAVLRQKSLKSAEKRQKQQTILNKQKANLMANLWNKTNRRLIHSPTRKLRKKEDNAVQKENGSDEPFDLELD